MAVMIEDCEQPDLRKEASMPLTARDGRSCQRGAQITLVRCCLRAPQLLGRVAAKKASFSTGRQPPAGACRHIVELFPCKNTEHFVSRGLLLPPIMGCPQC